MKVIIESPYFGDVEKNLEYARRCLSDSLGREEAAFASHLLYTCLLYTSPSPRDGLLSRMPSSA